MLEAPIPDNEPSRIASLKGLKILDTPAEERFDRITRLAQNLFEVPIVLVSLVDENRQWFKSRQGLDATETPRNISFCGHTITGKDILLIEDTLLDPRFSDNPLVLQDPKIRFYAGAPLSAPDGECVGTLCLIDRKAHKLSTKEMTLLRDLRDLVQNELAMVDLATAIRELNRTKVFFEVSQDLFCIASFDGFFKYVSPSWTEATGYSTQELLSKPFIDFVHPDDCKSTKEELSKLSEQKDYKLFNFENRYRTKTGLYRYLLWTASVFWDEGIVYAAARDITSRKLLEQTIYKKERELRDFFENSNVPLHWVDKHGIILWANKAELALLGYDEKEYIGQSISAFHADPPVIKDILQRLSRSETLSNYEARLRAKDGSTKTVSINSSVYAENGHFIHTRCFSIDITLKKQNALIEERFKAIVEGSDDSIISKDINGIITSWNHSAEGTFGYKACEIIGKPISILTPKDRSQEEPEILEQIMRGERIEHFETVRISKDHRLIDVSATFSPMKDDSGTIFGASVILRDITSKKEDEQKIIRLAQSKSEFLSVVSHELRTPLTVIKEAVSIIHDSSAGPLNHNQKKFSDLAMKNIDRLMCIINDLLDLQGFEAKAIKFNMGEVNIKKLLEELVGNMLINRKAHKKEAEAFFIDAADDLPIVYTDHSRVMQVLYNLLGNAIKFSPPGSAIKLRALCINNSVYVEIIDKGYGIRADDLPKLFQSFSQIGPPSERKTGGSGLGLVISKKIIRQLGGQIGVRSEFGKGSTFFFTLPLMERGLIK